MLYQTKNPHGGDIYGGEVKLDFSANTNPFGTPQGVLDAVRNALNEVHRYPDPYCRKLVQAISEFEGGPKEHILCGNGAAELIYAYCEALKPKRAAELAPTFAEYGLALERFGCEVERFMLRPETEFEVGEEFAAWLRETKPEVVFLCNPNNPTGKTLSDECRRAVLQVCREEQIRLFVDECFLDLSDGGTSLKEYIKDNERIFLLKAFTKSYGMAGLRLGYCLCSDEELLARMSKSVQPWNVSGLAQAAGVAALQEQEFLQKTREVIAVERTWLKSELTKLGFWVCPSEANYLLFRGPADLHIELKKQGIAIRNCDNYHGLGAGWYRIAVRLHEENECLIQAVGQIVERD